MASDQTDRIYPDTVLVLNGHRVMIPACLDPVRQALLGDLDDIEACDPAEMVSRTEGGEADAELTPPGDPTAARDPADMQTHGRGEHRSQAHPARGNGASNADGRLVDGAAPDRPETGNGGVTPEVTRSVSKKLNENKEVTRVAEVTGGDVGPAHTTHPRELAELLDEVVKILYRFVCLRKDRMYAEATALWIVGTHFFQYSNMFPRLVITSPEPNCGKSTLMKVMRFLCPSSRLIGRATAAALQRLIKQSEGQITLLLDDAEKLCR